MSTASGEEKARVALAAALRRRVRELVPKGTVQKVATRAGLPLESVMRLREETENPTLETVHRVAWAVGVQVSQLLAPPDEPTPKPPAPAVLVEKVDEALSGVEAAVAAARALLLGPPPPETPDQDLDTIDRGISAREARKGRTAARPQPESAVK